jgi:hypothetical protein
LFKKGQNDEIVFCKITKEQLDGGDDQGIGEVSNENSWRKVNRRYAQTNTKNINKTTLHCCRYDNDTTVLGRKLIFKFELTDNSSYQGKFI